jgi:galactokinase
MALTASGPEDRQAGLAAWFGECYGILPDLTWHAPGRVNLIGEHTDYNDGLVLPFALGRGVLAAAAARSDGLLELRSRQMPGAATSFALDRLRPGSVTGWAGYAAGAAWALRSAGYPVHGVSLGIDSDLPIGAGLASSAALCCAVVSCLAGLAAQRGGATAGQAVPARAEMAALARRSETDFVGMPCGIMDQSASMLCTAGHALLLDCRSGQSSAVPLEPARDGLRIIVVDTGVRHVLADGQYAARRQQCQDAARLLTARSLRDITDPGVAGRLPDPLLRRRARHVITENQRAEQTAALLRAGSLEACGGLLTASHASLRDDFEVSWPAADVTVTAALAAGALGARMTGGGFGGCVLALLPAGQLSAVTDSITRALTERGSPRPSFLIAEPADGARPVWPAASAAGSRPG